MKKKVVLFLGIFLLGVTQCFAYEPLFEADGIAPFSPTIGAVSAIYDPNDADYPSSTNISRWKSTRVRATASGVVTHFLIKINGSNGVVTAPLTTGAQIGFGVWVGSSDPNTAPGANIAHGVYDSFTFTHGPGWYAIPFTSIDTFNVIAGNYYDLAFYEQTESSNFARANNAEPFATKWGDSATAYYNQPPASGDWDVHFGTGSAPWLMGLLAEGGGSSPDTTPPSAPTGVVVS